MRATEAARRASLVPAVWRDLPRFALRSVAYRARSRDPGWLETPQLIELNLAGSSHALEVIPRDHIGRFLYTYGVWDILGTRLVRHALRPGMTVLDVGANIGYYSLVAAIQVGPKGLVQSFEPHDEIRERLTRNVAHNGLANVVVRPEAVTNVTGEVSFYPSADPSNEGISSTVCRPTRSGQHLLEHPWLVPAVRLDDVAAGLGRRIDLVKLDVEGAERDACEGGPELLSAPDAPLVLFEAYEIDPVATLLEAYGFTIRRLAQHWRRGLHLAPWDEVAAGGEPNYVAYKERHEPVLAGLA
jgi:FkbM family methyltransferase